MLWGSYASYGDYGYSGDVEGVHDDDAQRQLQALGAGSGSRSSRAQPGSGAGGRLELP